MTAAGNGAASASGGLVAEARRLVMAQGWHPSEAAQALAVELPVIFRALLGEEPAGAAFPVPGDIGGERGTPLYVDVAALLDGGLPDPPEPVLLHRDDGRAIFYAGQVNLVFGDPESGKTLVTQAAATEALRADRRVAIVDLDHNGPDATVWRLLDMGAPENRLRDPARFRYVEPEDKLHLLAVVAGLREWRPAVAVVDSIGELLPVMGLSSNSPDEFTTAHTRVLKPLAMAGAAVLAIDHLPKDRETRASGPTGTAAKRRAVGGVAVRVTVDQPFAPGKGGSAYLTVNKDRHGGLRRWCPVEPGKEPVAGVFQIEPGEHDIRWSVRAPATGEAPPQDRADPADLAELDALDPPPTSVRDVKDRLRWRSERATVALRQWRSRRSPSVPGEQGTLGDDDVIRQYIEWLGKGGRGLLDRLGELRGKALGCWCAPERCHGDVLAQLANADDPAAVLAALVGTEEGHEQ